MLPERRVAVDFSDWVAICETKACYCRCLDTKDWAGYADCFTESVVFELPPAGHVTRGRDAVVAMVRCAVESSKIPVAKSGVRRRAMPVIPAMAITMSAI
jgi:SnoaL-like domain